MPVPCTIQLGLGNGTEQGHLKPIQRETLVPGTIQLPPGVYDT